VPEHRILVVDDSAEVRDFLANTLLKLFHVDTAKDGKEGLSLLLANPPDLVISDHSMPKLTGLEMIRQMRQAGLDLPAILMTAEGSEELAAQAIRIGVNYYFIKPFDPDEVQEAVEHLLGAKLDDGPSAPRGDAGLALPLLVDLPDPVVVVDTEGKIAFCNVAAGEHLFASAPAQLVGQPLKKVTRDRALVNLFNGNHLSGAEVELVQENGHTFSARLGTIQDHRVAILRDITNLKKTNQAKSDLIATIVHDIRSPLTGILSYAELMKRVGNLNEQQQRFTDQMIQSVSRIKSLINDLLELDRLETGFARELELVDIVETTTSIIDSNRNKLAARHQNILAELPSGSVYVKSVPAHIQQIIANLIDNAIKYTPENGDIRVQIAAMDEQLILSISDTGIGIPIDEQPHVFDKFYRVPEIASQYEGTGLGLSIVKTIVESYKGRVWVESRPGSGSTFTVMLPTKRPTT
jgi:signal transduction histidine kinase